jgi:hypothetical protein
MDPPANGIFRWEIAALELFTDQRYGWTGGAVRFGEISAMNQGNAQSSKEM